MTTDLYAALGVPRDATTAQIRAAYRAAAKEHHPDRGGDPDKFAEISLAQEILCDPDRRAHYDRTGDTGIAQDPARQEEAKIAQCVAMLCDEVVLSSSFDLGAIDLVKQMVVAVDREIAEANRVIAACEKKRRRAEEALKRFAPDDESIVLSTLRRQDREIAEHVDKANKGVEMLKRMRETVAGHRYEFTAPPTPEMYTRRVEQPDWAKFAMDMGRFGGHFGE